MEETDSKGNWDLEVRLVLKVKEVSQDPVGEEEKRVVMEHQVRI